LSFIRKIKRNGRIYLAEVRNQRDGGKVRQHVVRYIGLAPGQEVSAFPRNLSELKIDGSRVFGSVIVLDFVAKQLGLYDLLGEHAHAILTLVFCHCHDYRSVLKVEQWFKKTDLKQIFSGKDISEKDLRNAIEALENHNQLALQKSIFENLAKFCNHDISSVVYDVTNTYFTGKATTLAKPGKDKEGVRGRRLIQIGLAVTKQHGLPIFHQVHPGNIHDSKIFGEAIVHLKQFGIKSGIIAYDRGITAKNSVFDLSNEHWKFIIGMPMHRGIKQLVSKMDLSELETYRNRVEQGISTFYVTTTEYSFGRTNGKLAILLNPRKKQAKKEERIQQIIQAQKNFFANEPVDPTLKIFLTKSGKLNTHAIKRKEKLDGLSFIFTNGRYSRQEIVQIYFGKDLIEKSFHTLKGVLSLRPIRMWLEENVKAHVMICYLAYALLTTLRFLLQKNGKKQGISDLSVEDAIEELANVYRVYFHRDLKNDAGDRNNSQLNKLVTFTRRQENILKAVSPKLVL
jgi:transposase